MNRMNRCQFVVFFLLLIIHTEVGEAQDASSERGYRPLKYKVKLGQRPREADLPIDPGILHQGDRTFVWVKQLRGKSDLKIGDVLVKIGDKDVESAEMYRHILQNSFVGSRVSLTVLRKKQLVSIPIQLIARRSKGVLGVQIEEADAGIFLVKVLKGLSAEKSGWKVGDQLLFIGSKRIQRIEDVKESLAPFFERDEVEVVLKRKGKVIRSTLKLSSKPIPAFLGIIFNENAAGPIPVQEVIKMSPAEKVGLKVGDLVVSINGRAINEGVDLKNILSEFKPGETLTILVKRKGPAKKKLY